MQVRFEKIPGSPCNEVAARGPAGEMLGIVHRQLSAVKWTADVVGVIGSIGRFPTLRAAKAAVEARLAAAAQRV